MKSCFGFFLIFFNIFLCCLGICVGYIFVLFRARLTLLLREMSYCCKIVFIKHKQSKHGVSKMNISNDMTLNTVEEAINNLELLSRELEKCSIKKEIYNSDFGYYLEQMSWEMHRMANETRERKSLWGGY